MGKIFFMVLMTGLLFFMGSCSLYPKDKLFQLPESGVKVTKDKIFNAKTGEVLVEIFKIKCPKFHYCAGLGVVYHLQKREVWVYPEEGGKSELDGKVFAKLDDQQKIWNQYYDYSWDKDYDEIDPKRKPKFVVGDGQKDQYTHPVYKIKISEDGKFITFKRTGRLFSSSYRWSIEYGEMD